jgi:hypothetical protein
MESVGSLWPQELYASRQEYLLVTYRMKGVGVGTVLGV